MCDIININIPTCVITNIKSDNLQLLGKCNNYDFQKDLKGSQKKDAIADFISKFDLMNIQFDNVQTNPNEELIKTIIIRNHLRRIDGQKFKNIVIESSRIIKASKRVMKELGISHRESVYQKALMHELRRSGFNNPQQENYVCLYYPTKPPTMNRKEAQINNMTYIGEARIDIELGDWVLELKQLSKNINTKERGQLYKYLQHTIYTQGLIINFNQSINNVEWTYQYLNN